MKKSRRGHKWSTTKRYEKIQKGSKWRVYSILPLCNFFGILCSENWNNSFKELTLLIFRAKPDVGRIHEQQQKKTRLDQGKIFIIRNTHTHGNLTRIGRTCQTLGKERHNIELILWESISITNLSSNEWIWKTCLLHWTSWRLPTPEKRRTTEKRGREKQRASEWFRKSNQWQKPKNTTKTTRNKLKHVKGYTAKVLDIK